VLTVDGGPGKSGADGRSGRVRAVLTPRNSDDSNKAGAPESKSAPALRRSSTLGGAKK
jgi:lipopolysaccharide export system protein LptA